MAVVALTPLSAELARWSGWVAHMAVEGLIGSASLVDVAPWLTRRLAPPSLSAIAAYYGSLLVVVGIQYVVPTFRSATFRSAAFRLALICLVASGYWIVETPTLVARSRFLRVTFRWVRRRGDRPVS
jgi:hypothetical protein